jgi:transcriptional regulator with XRE-family HTH domain
MAIALTAGEKVAYFRKKRGLSQAELGQIVHLSQRAVSYDESSGDNIDVERLRRYAIALQVEIGDLI